ncbi:hypothetical protein [Mesorhizobium australicum]|uniref:Uncharacterized protein n=1 Tax=Mesorhizobium australicum TaxID=536018 RepID=A0A1X7NVW3_9HYPH|nr:hypothetical protein [Mesorhizobium australicum]SMH42376.1 hypothetical protein SAMN02982922_2736 [Mesorhizobium australicum]
MPRLEPIRDWFDPWSSRRFLPTAEEVCAQEEERERRRVERHNRKIAKKLAAEAAEQSLAREAKE